MTLSRSAYKRDNATAKRRAAGEKAAWTRTKNERRIEALLKRFDELEAVLQAIDRSFGDWWLREGKFYDPDTEDVSWDDKREGLAEKAFHVAIAQSGNYTANDAVEPTEVVFGNGRRVWTTNGRLYVGWKKVEAYVDPETGLSGDVLDRSIDAAHKRTITRGNDNA